ncbi:MAG: PEP-utilizing enzyme [Dehalococcoidia bacterium]
MPKQEQSSRIWDIVPGYDFIEEVDLAALPSWFLDGTHSVPPLSPLFCYQWARFCSHGFKAACTELSIPTCKGWELRIHNNSIYCALHVVRDQTEIARREARFRQALRPWLEDFDGLWNKYKKELLGIYDNLKKLDVERASNLQLYHHNYDLMEAYTRMWEIHFMGMYTSFNTWLLLEALTKERFGLSDQEAAFQDMMRGFDNKIYQMDKKLWEFGRLAVEMKLGDLFKQNQPREILPKLKESEKGKEWLKAFMDYMTTDEIGGWRMQHFTDFNEPYWLEDPATPIGLVRDNIKRDSSYDLEATRAQITKKRRAAISAFLKKVPTEEKALFKGIIKLAGKASSYSEEHDLYCELSIHALMRRGYMAMGKRLAKSGAIDNPDDILLLNPDEIDRAIMVPEAHDLRWLTRRRRAAWQKAQKAGNPPVITKRSGLEEAVDKDLLPSRDAIAIKIVVGEVPKPKPSLKADLWGICGCSGEAEGVARVVNKYEDLKEVQPGEILVAPSTNPTWTPVFGLVNGVITDTGGTLCHAAIIGREYGVPTIVNVKEGTSLIKTGQRLKIDASNGAIYILDK